MLMKVKFAWLLIGMLGLILPSSCTKENRVVDDVAPSTVEVGSVDSNNNAQTVNLVEDSSDVIEIFNIVKKLDLIEQDDEMEFPSDYQFFFEYDLENMEIKKVTYHIWKLEDTKQLVISTDSPRNYEELDTKTSKKLYSLLLDEVL